MANSKPPYVPRSTYKVKGLAVQVVVCELKPVTLLGPNCPNLSCGTGSTCEPPNRSLLVLHDPRPKPLEALLRQLAIVSEAGGPNAVTIVAKDEEHAKGIEGELGGLAKGKS